MTTPNITFGIELEFIAVHDFQKNEEDPQDNYVSGFLWKKMREEGILATGYGGDDGHETPVSEIPRYSRWHVGTDDLWLMSEEQTLVPEGWMEEPIEISSRKFSLVHDDWRAEIQKVLDIMRSIEGRSCRFVTNATTGFHVHVGQHDVKIPLRTAKNVLQLCTAFERQLDHIGSIIDRLWWAEGKTDFPLSTFHYWQQPHANGIGGNQHREVQKNDDLLLDRLADIETLQSYQQLLNSFRISRAGEEPTGHESNINFDNLFENWKDLHLEPSGTIEFRGHTSTLHFGSIEAWVLLTTTLVQYSNNTPADAFIRLLLQGVDHSFTLRQLLESIQCPAQVPAFYCDNNLPHSAVLTPNGAVLTHSFQKTVTGLSLLLLCHKVTQRYARVNSPPAVAQAIKTKDESGCYGLPRPEDCPPISQDEVDFLVGRWLAPAVDTEMTDDEHIEQDQVQGEDESSHQVLDVLASSYSNDVQVMREQRLERERDLAAQAAIDSALSKTAASRRRAREDDAAASKKRARDE